MPRWASRLNAFRAENNEFFEGQRRARGLKPQEIVTPEEALGTGFYGGGVVGRSQGVSARQRMASNRAARGQNPDDIQRMIDQKAERNQLSADAELEEFYAQQLREQREGKRLGRMVGRNAPTQRRAQRATRAPFKNLVQERLQNIGERAYA